MGVNSSYLCGLANGDMQVLLFAVILCCRTLFFASIYKILENTRVTPTISGTNRVLSRIYRLGEKSRVTELPRGGPGAYINVDCNDNSCLFSICSLGWHPSELKKPKCLQIRKKIKTLFAVRATFWNFVLKSSTLMFIYLFIYLFILFSIFCYR